MTFTYKLSSSIYVIKDLIKIKILIKYFLIITKPDLNIKICNKILCLLIELFKYIYF